MIQKIKTFGSMIKFSHTLFALPFALSGALLAVGSGTFLWEKMGWIVLAMVGARTAAMSFNRVVDAKIDAKNPRTKTREIPVGKLSSFEVWVYVFLSIGLFVFSAYKLNTLCFYLSPVALIVVLGYSLTKRFTSLCHIVLGIGLALAPVGAWLAIVESFHIMPIVLGFGVLFWVAGFDILYACQDYEYDKENKLFSIPVKLGLKKTFWLSRIFHFLAISCFTSMFWLHEFHFSYFIGMICISGLIVYEHRLVQPNNLSKIDMAFFKMNGLISVVYFTLILLDFLMK